MENKKRINRNFIIFIGIIFSLLVFTSTLGDNNERVNLEKYDIDCLDELGKQIATNKYNDERAYDGTNLRDIFPRIFITAGYEQSYRINLDFKTEELKSCEKW